MGSSIKNNARPVRGDGHPNGRRLAPRSRWKLRRLPALALVCLAAASSGQADAEVAVDGGRHEMHVNVTNDTVGHVLEALSEKGTLRFRSTAPLDKVIGGSFSGTLGQVVSQVLTGFDFVIVDKPQERRNCCFRGERGEAHLAIRCGLSTTSNGAAAAHRKGRARQPHDKGFAASCAKDRRHGDAEPFAASLAGSDYVQRPSTQLARSKVHPLAGIWRSCQSPGLAWSTQRANMSARLLP